MTSMKCKEEPTECYELAQMTDFQEILEHEMLGCPTCLRIKMRNALGNQTCDSRASTSKVKEEPVTLTEQKPVISQADRASHQKKPSRINATAKNLVKTVPIKVEPDVCEELENMTDFQERLEHEMMGCPSCIRIKRNKALGNEFKNTAESTRKLVNYGDHAVKPAGVRLASAPASNAQVKPNERKRRADSDDSSEHKKRAYDKLIVRDLVRMEGLDKKEAAMRLVEQKRRPKIDEGDRISLDQMPWLPSPNILHLPRECYSSLLPVDHRRYVAIISNFLSTVPNFRFEMNKLEIEAMDDRLKEEREKFNKAAFDAVRHWRKSPFRYQAMGSLDFFSSRENAKYKMVLGSTNFCGKVKSVEWPRLYHRKDQMTIPNFRLGVSEVLQPGKQLRIHIPDYNMDPSVIEQHFALEPAVKISIDKDEKAMEYAMEKGIEYLMDGSTVRHLMSNKWPNRNQTFANRVSVVQRVKQGSIQRVVIVSKPVLASQLEILYLTRQFVKWTAKCELRSKFMPNSSKLRTSKATLREMVNPRSEPTVKSEENKKQIVITDIKMDISDEPTKKLKFDTSGMEESDDEECSLQIAENTEFTNNPMVVSPSAQSAVTLQPKVEVNDILGGILDSMGLSAQVQSSSSGNRAGHPQSFVAIAEEKVDSTSSSMSKRYSVMKFDNEGKHEILVRTSNHGVDQNGNAVSVTVKLEYIPEIGSDKLHLEEELWNLVTGIVKDSVEQYNLHMYPRIGHCLQIKRISGNQRTSNLSAELKQLLESRTARMCVLLDALDALEAGEYLIYPEGNSMTILKEAGSEVSPSEIPSDEIEFDSGSKVFNHISIAKKSLTMPPRYSNDFSKNWNGLNPHFPLVWHIVNGRIPGSMFPKRRSDLNWRPDEQFRKNNQQESPNRGKAWRGGSKRGRGGNVRNGAWDARTNSRDSNDMKMERDIHE